MLFSQQSQFITMAVCRSFLKEPANWSKQKRERERESQTNVSRSAILKMQGLRAPSASRVPDTLRFSPYLSTAIMLSIRLLLLIAEAFGTEVSFMYQNAAVSVSTKHITRAGREMKSLGWFLRCAVMAP